MNSNSKEMKRIIDAFKKPLRLNENKNVIDLTSQYQSGNITHKAKPGELIEINMEGIGWIKGEVYLTQGNDVAYHGGLIHNVDNFINKVGGLYLTRSLIGAFHWPGVRNRPQLRRVYEVKIKSNSLFINSSPAAKDYDGLTNEKNALKPMGILGMSDENFRFNKHEGTGTQGSEGLILDSSAIESFRVIPFSELIENDNIKSFKSSYEKFNKWYNEMKDAVTSKYFFGEYEKIYGNDTFLDNWDTFKNSISKQVDEKINTLSDNELIELQRNNTTARW